MFQRSLIVNKSLIPLWSLILFRGRRLEATMMFGVTNPESKSGMFKFGPLFAALVLCVMAVAAVTTSAQVTGSATLRGTLKDPKGAVVPNATVTLISEGTKAE